MKMNKLFGVTFLFLLFTVTLTAQSTKVKKYPFTIPAGEQMYSQDFRNVEPLEAYEKRYYERSSFKYVHVIEAGDFFIQEFYDGGDVYFDTLYYAVSTMRILNQDTTITIEPLEFKKQNIYPIKANLVFEKDKIRIEQDPKHIFPIYSVTQYKNNYVYPKEKNLYFKLGDEHSFRYDYNSVNLSLMTIPFKIRLKNKETTAEARFNNLELYLGYHSVRYHYKNEKLTKLQFSIGPYIGPTVIDLDENNSLVNGRRLGLTYGVGLIGGIDRVQLGLAIGFESISHTSVDWEYNNRVYLGFIAGYKLNANPSF